MASKLNADERTILELFAFGKTKRIAGRYKAGASEGYAFEGVPELGWSTARVRRALESLQMKALLTAEVSDRILLCKDCRSPNLRLRRLCPVCKSINLSKHSILEHFACGMVDKEEAFMKNGSLVCPKCSVKLELLDSDYRNLSYMYACQDCNGLNRELLETMVCSICGTEAEVDKEDEVTLCAYHLNEPNQALAFAQIKPVEECTAFFKSLGHAVEAPALVAGKSGARHTFDLLIGRAQGGTPGRDSRAAVVVEILLSDKPIEVDEVARVYGKLSDLYCDSIILAVPGLAADARNYASSFRLRILEGTSIQEALAASEASARISKSE
ncbi:MAG TPA: hypothetical protein VLU91_03020 [Nitrososphaerales archaeon]|nr:hypothetical protein [Nitrososphaerales archaeon]